MDFLGTASTALPGESMAPLGRLFSDYVLSEAAPLAPPPATTIDRCEPVLIESARLWELPAAATVPFLPIESEQPKLLALASLLISSVCRPGWAARRCGTARPWPNGAAGSREGRGWGEESGGGEEALAAGGGEEALTALAAGCGRVRLRSGECALRAAFFNTFFAGCSQIRRSVKKLF